MERVTLTVRTPGVPAVVDLTSEVARFVAGRGDGVVVIFLPHATAGLAIVETGAGSDRDLLDRLAEILPRDDSRYRHRHGSPGHGADHLLPAFLAPTLTIPVVAGRMTLGTWQSVVLVDTNPDNPERSVQLGFLSG